MLIEHVSAFAKGEKAMVSWEYSVLAILWVIWIERNNRIFRDFREEDVNYLRNRASFLASLWTSISKEFQDTLFIFIHLNWEGVLIMWLLSFEKVIAFISDVDNILALLR